MDKSREELEAIDRTVRMYSKLKVAFAPVIARGVSDELIRDSVNDAKQNLFPVIDELKKQITW